MSQISTRSKSRNGPLPEMIFEAFKAPVRRQSTGKQSSMSEQGSVSPGELTQIVDNSASRYYNKNAFRYICRIAFKEGCTHEYRQRLAYICNQTNIRMDQLVAVFSKAEAISGPRFFQEMVTELNKNVAKALVDYLMWFLKTRYLRYLDRNHSPRRRPNNRQQYLKYKNFVMIPMLRSIMRERDL